MVKDLLKASIIGASIIVSTIIYSEKNLPSKANSCDNNKFAFIDAKGAGQYSVLDQETGEVQTFRIVDGPMEGYTFGEPFLAKYYTKLDSNDVVRINGNLIHIDSKE